MHISCGGTSTTVFREAIIGLYLHVLTQIHVETPNIKYHLRGIPHLM
jgi:hypothetical protein